MTTPTPDLARQLIKAHCQALLATLNDLSRPVPRDDERKEEIPDTTKKPRAVSAARGS